MQDDEILLTPEGLEKIKKELYELKNIRRKEVANKIEAAKALGDLSENAEYQAAKEESAWIEGRILELSDILARAKVVQETKKNVVNLGSTVVVQSGKTNLSFKIVGMNEADPVHGLISNNSPLGAALIGRKVGEEVEVNTPGGLKKYKIIKIE